MPPISKARNDLFDQWAGGVGGLMTLVTFLVLALTLFSLLTCSVGMPIDICIIVDNKMTSL